MRETTRVEITVKPGTPLIPYGPAGDQLPARFSAVVDPADRPLRVSVEATFDGIHRVHAERVCIERTDGASVEPETLSAVRLATVMSTVVFAATQHAAGTVARGGRTRSGPPTDEELKELARMYWSEWVSWGQPRQAIMSSFGDLPRSTANRWIRLARDRYGLPGIWHAEDGEG